MVLVFYPQDGARASVEVLRHCQAALPMFERLGASVLAISVDAAASHAGLASQLGLSFPLLADSEPLGAVARAYGVYWENAEASYHAAFVLDEHGIVRWSCLAGVGTHPDVAAILRALSRLGPRPRLAAAEPFNPTKEAA
jgi:peroxiredoxin